MAKKYISIDGNTACAKVAYQMSDMAIIYPITPSSPMAETVDELRANETKNAFGNSVSVTEMQSEAGVAGALHGALSMGNLATTFTSSQGLLLMLPNMYKIAGELLPCVIHVAARTVATHALSIFGDHSDVMSARATGFAMLSSASVQEAQDMAMIAHLSTLETRIPFLHFFDGFRTSHEINKIEELDPSTIKSLIDENSVNAFRATGLSSDTPSMRGTAQNPDVFFQNREAGNELYNNLPQTLENVMTRFYKETGRKYELFDYYGAKDATDIIIAMGSGCETIAETIDYLNSLGNKFGMIKVHLYRPFSTKHFLAKLPKTTKRITVLDRTKESGSVGEPLYTDICSLLNENKLDIPVVGGRYGLSSKEFSPSMVLAVYENMQKTKPKNHFTVGIVDDVTNTSLEIKKQITTLPEGTVECKFYGFGSDGTVSANKNSIKIIGDATPLYAQAYFEYDSKKAGSVTISHLRFGASPIRATYLSTSSDFVACHNPSFVGKFDMLSDIKKNGIFLLNCSWDENELEEKLPAEMKRKLASKNIALYVVDANKIANEVGMPGRINLVMQTAFFSLANIVPFAKGIELIKAMATKSYAKKGEKVLSANMKAIDLSTGATKAVKYPSSWKTATQNTIVQTEDHAYYTSIMDPIAKKLGDKIPVSAFTANGEIPTTTAKLEKRAVAMSLPCWNSEKCIQCNQCSLVCPHACIRPYLIKSGTPLSKKLGAKPAMGIPGYDFVMQLSPADCTGCGNCAHICPVKDKAIEMVTAENIYAVEETKYKLVENYDNPTPTTMNVKNSQFKKPLFEFSGACAGCGETPYIKLLTQLYGDKMIVANATGCSSIYSGSFPVCPYSTNKAGHGPAWANSLFEDNAEFGYGMLIAHKNNMQIIENAIKTNLSICSTKLKALLAKWLDGEKTEAVQNEIIKYANAEFDNSTGDLRAFLVQLISQSSALTEKSIWTIGGDGWAYDIGFGGIDHVLSSNEKVRILVLDTEVYSNTGGQCSKSTPMGSVAKFAASGKQTQKKDLSIIATNYPNCYVATISLGANMPQAIKAFEEAEAHDGPSIIIAYAPCMNHGINMSKTTDQEKMAVTSGYFPLFRFNPQKTPSLTLDPPFATGDYEEFLSTQTRYTSLVAKHPEEAKQLFEDAKQNAIKRIQKLQKLSK